MHVTRDVHWFLLIVLACGPKSGATGSHIVSSPLADQDGKAYGRAFFPCYFPFGVYPGKEDTLEWLSPFASDQCDQRLPGRLKWCEPPPYFD